MDSDWNTRPEIPKAYAPLTTIQVAGLVCSFCLKNKSAASSSLRKCSACQRVAYCKWTYLRLCRGISRVGCSGNNTCQKKDWKMHKDLCNSFQVVNKYDRQLGDESYDLVQYYGYQASPSTDHTKLQPYIAHRKNVFRYSTLTVPPIISGSISRTTGL